MTESQPGSDSSGQLRVGQYEILEVIGRGATGTVYRAQGESRETVALKMLHSGAADETVERFTREVAIAQQLVHRHIVGVIDAGLEDGLPYLVMELLRGQSIREIIRDSDGGVGIDRAVDLVAQLCLGLHYAHEHGLVHRDVKPANAFVTRESVVKVLDFGVAKLSDTTVTADGALVGTLAYMAPEQLHGRGEIDGRADVFSAGVILYELLAGRRPFDAESSTAMLGRILHEPPSALPASVGASPQLQSILARALEKDPDRRFATAQEFAHALWITQLEARVTVPSAAPAPAAAPAAPSSLPLRNLHEPAPEPIDMTLKAPAPVIAHAAPSPAESGARPRWIYWAAAALVATVVAGAGSAVILNRPAPEPLPPPVEQPPPPIPDPPKEAPVVPTPITSADVQVESTPPGAAISLNGVARGTTPQSLRLDVNQGLQLRLAGHEPAAVTVDTATLEAGRLVINLTPITRVRLRARGPYPFEIVSGNQTISRMGETHEVSVSIGQMVTLRSRELLLDQRMKIDGPGGTTQNVEIPEPGLLSVRTRPGADEQCQVQIDQRDFGNPPLPNLPLAAGTHQLELKCPDGTVRRERIRVVSGEPQVHTVR